MMTELQPLVSIIIPMYNASDYIEATLLSALGQTWPNVEVIVIDDESTDNSLTVAKQYKDKITVLQQSNKGASAARNLGLASASGKYIQFLDADDLLSADKIAAQVEVLNGSEDYLALCGTVHFTDGDDHLTYSVQHDWGSKGTEFPLEFLLDLYGANDAGGMIQTNAWLTPKALIDKVGYWNEMRSPDDDGEFFCRLLLAGKGIKYSFAGINYYRKFAHRNSLSTQRSLKSFEGTLKSTDLKYNHLKAVSNNPVIDKVFARHYREIGVAAYPQYKSLSREAINKALSASVNEPTYKGGALATAISKILGWRLMRIMSHIRYRIKMLAFKKHNI